ncbi:MAG: glycosyltransferase family 2 protein [Bacteriovoracia bacterium]
MGKISACVITLNEESSLERALKSLGFADEIIVVDSFSSDQSLKIAQRFTNLTFQRKWEGFAQQRNFALSKCTGDWIFFLDADEKASEQLGKELRRIASSSTEKPNCFSVQRIEYFLGKELRFGPGNPSHQWRFFKKGVRFEGDIHEYPLFDGPVGRIEQPIYHWPELDIERFIRKLNHYTSLEALDRFKQGQKTTLLHAFLTFFSTFLKNGIRYKGFWNGKEGVVLTLLESVSRVVRHLKLWSLWQIYEGKLKLEKTLPKPGSKIPPAKHELERPVWREL